MQFGDYTLEYIKLVLFANKETFHEDLLDRCVALYEQVYRRTEEQETSDAVTPYWSKMIKRWNISCKQDAEGAALDPANRDSQRGLSRAPVCPQILLDQYQPFQEYAEQHQLRPIPGIPISFLLPDSKHTDILWVYLQFMFHMTQQFVGAPVEPGKGEALETRISELDKEQEIQYLLSNDIYLKTVLYSPTKDPKLVSETAAKAIRDMGVEDEAVFDIVNDATANIFEEADGDTENMGTATTMSMLKIAKDIVKKRKGPALQKCCNRDMIGKLMKSVQTVTKGSDVVPAGVRDLMVLAERATQEGDQASVDQLEQMTASMGMSKETMMKLMS